MSAEFKSAFRAINGDARQFRVSGNPDVCPQCNTAIEVAPIEFYERSDNLVEGIYKCNRNVCRKLFIATFGMDGAGLYQLQSVAPNIRMPVSVDSILVAISPEFAAAYVQSYRALQNGLDKVAGPGFRRALEFLVKDYASKDKSEGEREVIRAKALVKCVKEHIAEVGIQTVAERAAWLGNDEVHYLRKWDQKDVKDLIALIDATGAWIVIHEKTNALLTEMQPK